MISLQVLKKISMGCETCMVVFGGLESCTSLSNNS
jgi:hypothetical protein